MPRSIDQLSTGNIPEQVREPLPFDSCTFPIGRDAVALQEVQHPSDVVIVARGAVWILRFNVSVVMFYLLFSLPYGDHSVAYLHLDAVLVDIEIDHVVTSWFLFRQFNDVPRSIVLRSRRRASRD